MSSKIQTSDEIVKIVGASPFFLARVARARRLADLHIVANIHHQDGSSDLVTSMTSQPEYISEDVADEYSYPGLPYLLDIVFDEQVSGIRTDPARPRPAKITREDWALQAVRRMFKDSKDVPKASKLNAVAFQLLAYSVERHDQEVNLEMQATRHCLAMLQKHFSNQKPDHNLPVSNILRQQRDPGTYVRIYPGRLPHSCSLFLPHLASAGVQAPAGERR